MSAAVSGMHAAKLQLDVAANNIANVSTTGFQPSQVALTTQAAGGVAARVAPGQSAPALPGVAASEQPSGTELLTEMATLITAPAMYAANARVVDVTGELTRSLLDVKA